MKAQRKLNRYTADIIAQMNAGQTHLFLVAVAASVIEHAGGSSRVCRFDGGSPITNKLRFNLEGVEHELKIREQKRGGATTCKAILYTENESGRMTVTTEAELAGMFWLRDMRPGLSDSVASLSALLTEALGFESFAYSFVKQLLINWNEIAAEGAANQARRQAAGLPTLPATMNAKTTTIEPTTTEDDIMTVPKNETPEQTTARKAKDAARKRKARAAKKAAAEAASSNPSKTAAKKYLFDGRKQLIKRPLATEPEKLIGYRTEVDLARTFARDAGDDLALEYLNAEAHWTYAQIPDVIENLKSGYDYRDDEPTKPGVHFFDGQQSTEIEKPRTKQTPFARMVSAALEDERAHRDAQEAVNGNGRERCPNTVDLETGTTDAKKPAPKVERVSGGDTLAKAKAENKRAARREAAAIEATKSKPTKKPEPKESSVLSFGDIAAGAPLSSSDIDPICVWLKESRKAAGLTQTALAELAGVKQPNIARAERGVIPTVPILRRYCAILGEYTIAGPK